MATRMGTAHTILQGRTAVRQRARFSGLGQHLLGTSPLSQSDAFAAAHNDLLWLALVAATLTMQARQLAPLVVKIQCGSTLPAPPTRAGRFCFSFSQFLFRICFLFFLFFFTFFFFLFFSFFSPTAEKRLPSWQRRLCAVNTRLPEHWFAFGPVRRLLAVHAASCSRVWAAAWTNHVVGPEGRDVSGGGPGGWPPRQHAPRPAATRSNTSCARSSSCAAISA